ARDQPDTSRLARDAWRWQGTTVSIDRSISPAYIKRRADIHHASPEPARLRLR
uniref:Uncharacterized protein n=1 Tax=Aegilops tauschii subsp. strangulata TaxID=200361 RepID=A0A453G1D5_AEGTS